ncbi:uncharacterized protein N0V89_009490 [Didymosphaeria variabile]|uniref:Uncharacterized protein n=1 Tax=Didymosphaeria variabile TaxID=1932322 RepID=A0A9W9C7B4_9PLEO|nr:uncharacterized protein N0V89_009490 [Didymosphaeria variabile]KAJ4348118.1 hypothetical protein N0V89_009490 [Didymosphaeria variabile]
MSGNPFRASLVLQNHPAAAPPTSVPPADSSDRRDEGYAERDDDSVLGASSAPTKTKKTVRIESPTETIPPYPDFGHVENETFYGTNTGRYAGSPPLESSPAYTDELADRYPQDPARQQVDERGMLGNEWKSTGTPQSATSPSGAPANPFSRTLATIESQEKGGNTTGPSKERTPTDKVSHGPKRQSLNVEGFKNLLMQGIASPRSSAPPLNAPAPSSNSLSPAVFESSSSTDTSSISRQSIFDTTQEPHPESPRTSYDMTASDDEHAGLMGGVAPKKEKKKPPPAPRHRHGKLVKERTPQTVSFEGFSAAETTPELEPSKRTNSDLNKPLPPTPPTTISAPAHIITQDTSTQVSTSISEGRDNETASISETAPTPTQKKVPPPVPLARRQSQLRSSTTGNRSRSNSSLTMSSQHSTDLPPINYGQEPTSHLPTTSKAPPPPPPSRRHGNALSTINTPSANCSSNELSTSARPTTSSPIPPSSRRTTLTSEPSSPVSGLARTSSIQSARDTSRAVSGESTSNLPPPPPPPRRRQSGRSSLDIQRPSLPSSSPVGSRHPSSEYKRNSRSSIDGKRQGSIASVSSLSREYAPADKDEQALYSPREEPEEQSEQPFGEGRLSVGKEEGDAKRKDGSNASKILDDMERFQKEIDELRERYQKAA